MTANAMSSALTGLGFLIKPAASSFFGARAALHPDKT